MTVLEIQETSGAIVEVYDGPSSRVDVQETAGSVVEVHDETTNTVVEIHGSPATTVVEVQQIAGSVIEVHGAPTTVVEVHEGSGGTAVVDLTPFVYVMPAAQTTATVDHDLGRDPVSIQVLDDFGNVYEEFSITYTVPKEQVRIGFDIPIKATIRMM